ncbi:MAG TPA: hypothetical protein VEQ85_05050, partial [Lacipirellulaceae bacterium]|nr:hypothetical protein [Lacipirellulaceae bacterium]
MTPSNAKRGVAVWILVLLFGLPAAPAAGQTWMNETDSNLELDFGNLQFPGALTLQPGQSTGLVYGRMYQAGLTEALGPPVDVLAHLGYGPAASDPRVDPNWTWLPATYGVQVGNDDEFFAAFNAPAAPGAYSYTYRYSLDNGASWTAADLDGAGANGALAFSAANLGVLTVSAVPPPAVDFANLQFPASVNVQAFQSSGLIYSRVYESGVTPLPGESGALTASIGYGPAGSDPRTSSAWTWTGANHNTQVGNDDEYFAAFTAPGVNGTYWYTFRYSLDGGANWTLGDLDGNGANSGLSFSLAQLGVMTVTGGVPPVFGPADFDRSRTVDAADLAVWRTALAAGTNGADADGDGDSDGADFVHWQRSLGVSTVDAAAQTV